MENFLKTNPGLNSRFDKMLKFEDYSPEELNQIAHHMLAEQNLVPTPDAEAHLRAYLTFLYDFRDKYFGNARTVRGVVQEIVKNQHLRLAALPPEDRSAISVNILTLEDVASFQLDKSEAVFTKKTIGFRRAPSEGAAGGAAGGG